MSKYQPNSVPLLTRLAMAFTAVFLVFFAAVQLMTGYTYIISRRGGILLHGMPSVMVVLTVTALCAAALLTILDHYDKRPNEEFYKYARGLLLKSATIFFFAGVPLFLLLDFILRNSYDIDILSNIPGFAENFSFYSPELNQFIPYLKSIFRINIWISLTGVLLILSGFFILKLFPKVLRRQALILGSLGFMAASAFMIAETLEDLLTGETEAGRGRHKYIINAWSEPAKFNAILLTHFTLSGAVFVTCATAFVGLVTRRIK
jgi:hypothetical protein